MCYLPLLIEVSFICISNQAQCFTVTFPINKHVILLVVALTNAKQ